MFRYYVDYDSNFSSWHILTSLCYDKVYLKVCLFVVKSVCIWILKFDRERDTLSPNIDYGLKL